MTLLWPVLVLWSVASFFFVTAAVWLFIVQPIREWWERRKWDKYRETLASAQEGHNDE